MICSHRLNGDWFCEPGFELGFDQIFFKDVPSKQLNDLLAGESTDRKAVAYREDDRYVYITGEDFS